MWHTTFQSTLFYVVGASEKVSLNGKKQDLGLQKTPPFETWKNYFWFLVPNWTPWCVTSSRTSSKTIFNNNHHLCFLRYFITSIFNYNQLTILNKYKQNKKYHTVNNYRTLLRKYEHFETFSILTMKNTDFLKNVLYDFYSASITDSNTNITLL